MDDVKLQLNHLLFSGDFAQRENESTYIETLAPILSGAIAAHKTDEFEEALAELESQKEAELKAHCDACTGPFFDTAEYLAQIKLSSEEIGQTATAVHQQITRTGNSLVDSTVQHQQLTQTTSNITKTLETLRLCLRALDYTNQVHTLLKHNHRTAAVQALSELKHLGLHSMRHLGLGKMLSKSVPGLSDLILSSTKSTLDAFVEDLTAQEVPVGETSYECLRNQRDQWHKLQLSRPHLAAFRFNSHAERAYRESYTNYFDIKRIGLDLGPLHEAFLVFSKLNKLEDVVGYIQGLRLAQSKQLDGGSWGQLQSIIGFCVIERILSRELPDLRPEGLVEDMCDQLCQRFTQNLTSRLPQITSLDELTKIQSQLTDFMETMENFGFSVSSVSGLLLELLKHLSKRLVAANRESFINTWNQADHMPMVVNKPELYDTINNVVFGDIEAKPASFPKALPFSEIYPLMCADLRSLISHHMSFFDQFQRDPVVVEETMVAAVDTYLSDTVCKTMVESASVDNREKLIQTVIDLKYLYDAAIAIRSQLQAKRMSGRRGKLTLRAVTAFEQASKTVESKVFELVNGSIDDFVSTANYDWRTSTGNDMQSAYALDMAAYLLTLANSVLARLPSDLKSFVYLTIIDHLNTKLMDLLVSAPENVTPLALDDFDRDLTFLESTVSQLSQENSTNANMLSTLLETRQSIDLLRSTDPCGEYYNNADIRMRKYTRVDGDTAKKLLHKVITPVSTPKVQQTSNFMRYLGGDRS